MTFRVNLVYTFHIPILYIYITITRIYHIHNIHVYIYIYIDILWYIMIYIYIYIHTYIVIFAYPQHMSTPFQAFRRFRARLRTLQRLSRRGCPSWPSPACWATQRLRKSDGKHMQIHRENMGKHGKWWKMMENGGKWWKMMENDGKWS